MSHFGIVNIVNKTNGKQFIFKSTNLVKKIENTRNQLNFGCHYNKELQKDWNDFGPNNFKFNILKSNLENEEDLNLNFIKCLDDIDYVYNSPVKDLIEILDCDVDILTNKLYDFAGNEVNTESFNQKLKEYNLSNQDGFNFKTKFVKEINQGLINHSNFDERYENYFKEISDEKLLNSLYLILDEVDFDKQIKKHDLNEEIKLEIINELKNKIVEDKLKNKSDISKTVNLLIVEEYSKKQQKDKIYDKLYDLTGKNSLKREFKYLLNSKGLSVDVGFRIRDNLEKLIEKGEVTELTIEDVFNILVEEEFKKSKEEIYSEKQFLINHLNQMDFDDVLEEHDLHFNAKFNIKEEITLQINQNKIKTTDDIEFKSFRMIKDLEINDVEERLNELDKDYIDKIMINNNLKSGIISRKQSKINKILKNVPVNKIKEYLIEYTGHLSLKYIPDPNIVYCPQCGVVNESNADFCNQCGSRIE